MTFEREFQRRAWLLIQSRFDALRDQPQQSVTVTVDARDVGYGPFAVLALAVTLPGGQVFEIGAHDDLGEGGAIKDLLRDLSEIVAERVSPPVEPPTRILRDVEPHSLSLVAEAPNQDTGVQPILSGPGLARVEVDSLGHLRSFDRDGAQTFPYTAAEDDL